MGGTFSNSRSPPRDRHRLKPLLDLVHRSNLLSTRTGKDRFTFGCIRLNANCLADTGPPRWQRNPGGGAGTGIIIYIIGKPEAESPIDSASFDRGGCPVAVPPCPNDSRPRRIDE